jgi:hypothetical protein
MAQWQTSFGARRETGAFAARGDDAKDRPKPGDLFKAQSAVIDSEVRDHGSLRLAGRMVSDADALGGPDIPHVVGAASGLLMWRRHGPGLRQDRAARGNTAHWSVHRGCETRRETNPSHKWEVGLDRSSVNWKKTAAPAIDRGPSNSIARRHSRRSSESLAKTCTSGSHRSVAPRSRIHGHINHQGLANYFNSEELRFFMNYL